MQKLKYLMKGTENAETNYEITNLFNQEISEHSPEYVHDQSQQEQLVHLN